MIRYITKQERYISVEDSTEILRKMSDLECSTIFPCALVYYLDYILTENLEIPTYWPIIQYAGIDVVAPCDNIFIIAGKMLLYKSSFPESLMFLLIKEETLKVFFDYENTIISYIQKHLL